MDTNSKTHMFEVAFENAQNVYVVADERHEVVEVIGQKYDTDSYSIDWRNFEIVGEHSDSIERAIMDKGEPYDALWLAEDGVRGMRNRTNIAGKNSLYWI